MDEVIVPIDNPDWFTNHEMNLFELEATLNYANDVLADGKGYIALNEVFNLLYLEETEEGALAGWIRGAKVEIVEIIDGDSGSLKLNPNSKNVFRDRKK